MHTCSSLLPQAHSNKHHEGALSAVWPFSGLGFAFQATGFPKHLIGTSLHVLWKKNVIHIFDLQLTVCKFLSYTIPHSQLISHGYDPLKSFYTVQWQVIVSK